MCYVCICVCSKLQAQFQSMEVRNSCFAAFIDIFTPNTYVMVIMSDPSIRKYNVCHVHPLSVIISHFLRCLYTKISNAPSYLRYPTTTMGDKVFILSLSLSLSPLHAHTHSFTHTASAATLVNIRNARKHFEKIEKLDGVLPPMPASSSSVAGSAAPQLPHRLH